MNSDILRSRLKDSSSFSSFKLEKYREKKSNLSIFYTSDFSIALISCLISGDIAFLYTDGQLWLSASVCTRLGEGGGYPRQPQEGAFPRGVSIPRVRTRDPPWSLGRLVISRMGQVGVPEDASLGTRKESTSLCLLGHFCLWQ